VKNALRLGYGGGRHKTHPPRGGLRHGMVRTASIFSQILGLVGRVTFLRVSRKHGANHYTKRFSAWDHFVAMVFCQLAQSKSLREVCDGFGSAMGKLVHLGVRQLPNKSTLAYANAHRPSEFFRDLFLTISGELHQQLPGGHGKRHGFRFKQRLSLNASIITLCLSLFPWAKYTRTKGGVKLHLLLDHDGYWPTYAHLTNAQCSDVSVARALSLPRGSIVVTDRGYVDLALWGRWTAHDEVFFVTRMKSNLPYRVIEVRLRRIEARDPNTGKTVVLLTNHEAFAADTIAQICRDRWKIELFFKALKQNLKVKTFLGTTENALAVQLWTALIAMLLVTFLKWRSRRGWSLSNLVALLRWNLFQYKNLWEWLDDLLETPPGVPDHPQLVLPGFDVGQMNRKAA